MDRQTGEPSSYEMDYSPESEEFRESRRQDLLVERHLTDQRRHEQRALAEGWRLMEQVGEDASLAGFVCCSSGGGGGGAHIIMTLECGCLVCVQVRMPPAISYGWVEAKACATLGKAGAHQDRGVRP